MVAEGEELATKTSSTCTSWPAGHPNWEGTNHSARMGIPPGDPGDPGVPKSSGLTRGITGADAGDLRPLGGRNALAVIDRRRIGGFSSRPRSFPHSVLCGRSFFQRLMDRCSMQVRSFFIRFLDGLLSEMRRMISLSASISYREIRYLQVRI